MSGRSARRGRPTQNVEVCTEHRTRTRTGKGEPGRVNGTVKFRMPAEWEKHKATWIAWPHHEPDWPGKLAPIPWVYAEIVRALSESERVEILCHDETVAENARTLLAAHGVKEGSYRLHPVSSDRVWLRDSAPTGVIRADGQVELVNWGFNGWAKYDNYKKDAEVGRAIARLTGLPRIEPVRPDNGERLV